MVSKSDSQKYKILILEDELDALDMYSREFNKECLFDIYMARTVKEARRLFKQYQFKAALVDLVLVGEGNGFDVLTAIKKDKKQKGIKVYAFSNLMEKGNAEKAKALGASKYILKNRYVPKEIYNLVKKAVVGKAARVGQSTKGKANKSLSTKSKNN